MSISWCRERLKQTQVHHGKNRAPARSREVVERLLLNSNREPQRIGDWNFARAVSQASPQRSNIRHQEFTLGIVIRVISGTARQNKRTFHAPARVRAEIETASGRERLGGCILRFLYTP